MRTRTRATIVATVAVLVLLAFVPPIVRAYTDWLWFGEVGYRGVWTRVFLTRWVVFLVIGALVGGAVFLGMRVAFRARPLFPSSRSGDATRAVSTGGAAAEPSVRRRHSGDVRIACGTDRARELGDRSVVPPWGSVRLGRSAVRARRRLLRVRSAVLPVGAQLAVRRGVPRGHRECRHALLFGGIRSAEDAEHVFSSPGAHPAGFPGGTLRVAQGGRVLARPVRAAVVAASQAVHRRRLHRHQRGAARQADPDGHRGHLRGGLSSR